MKVHELMTTAVKTCAPDTNLSAVTELMWTHDCGVIPVVNDRGEVQGLVTDRDICIALGTTGTAAPDLTARDVMSREVVGCVPEDTCLDALTIMQRRRVRRLPVLGIGGVLLGLVSLNDIALRAVRAPAGDALREGLVEAFAAICGHHPLARAAGASAISR
jgi:CBS domain-containing protein